MNRETIQPSDRSHWLDLKRQDLTSTEIASLFNLQGPCQPTRFELWHRKVAGILVSEDVDNERAEIGREMEHTIAAIAARRNRWTLQPKKSYTRISGLRIGSSFDYESVEPSFLVECKNVDGLVFRNEWVETDFGLEAPPTIELQAQHECLVSGIGVCYIAALVGGNRLEVLERKADPELHEAILRACAAFWASSEPEPDFHRDAAFIGRLYGYSAPGSTLEADDELAALFREYAGHRALAKTASDNVDAAKAAILRKIGDAERVTHESFTLSTKMVKEADIAYHREAYRGFRLTERKAQ